jgi:hypothetical protein
MTKKYLLIRAGLPITDQFVEVCFTIRRLALGTGEWTRKQA